jgi:hypothetical protein
MAQAGAHLVDDVLPDAPLRQWVLTVPLPLRMLLAKDAALLSSVIRILVGVLERSYAMRAQQLGIANPKTGMLTAPQRFGGSMNLHVHLHCAAINGGVYTIDEHGAPRFHFLPALTPTDIHWVCCTVAKRICNLLRRRGLLRDRADDNEGAVRLAPSTALDACRQAALSRGRFERLDPKGRAQQQLFPDEPTFSRG